MTYEEGTRRELLSTIQEEAERLNRFVGNLLDMMRLEAGALELRREWAGLYDECELDGNMILGNWPGKLDNFYVACGFSGHGLMHAPAVGRALAELVTQGRFETIDLARMGYRRVLDRAPYRETGII